MQKDVDDFLAVLLLSLLLTSTIIASIFVPALIYGFIILNCAHELILYL